MMKPKSTIDDLPVWPKAPEGRKGKLRLDANEALWSLDELLPSLLADITAEDIQAYPEYGKLERMLAKYLGLSTDELLITNGSGEAIDLVIRTFINAGDKVVVPKPTFGKIPVFLKVEGAELVEIPFEDDLTRFDMSKFDRALSDGACALFLPNPNNPTGAWEEPSGVLKLIEKHPDKLFLIDEAYAEFVDATLRHEIRRFPNLIVTGTFSKAYGLAGLRVGWAAAQPHVIDNLRKVRMPYPVNAVAAAVVCKLIEQGFDIAPFAKEAVEGRRFLARELESRGFTVVEGHANFVLARFGADATNIARLLRERDILVRDLSKVPGIEGYLRITSGPTELMRRFLEGLDAVLSERALLFDIDETLVDTSGSYMATVLRLVEELNDQPASADEYVELKRRGGFNDDWELACEMLRRRGKEVPIEDIAKLGKRIFATLGNADKPLISGDWLKKLKKRYRLGVVSGRYRDELKSIEHLLDDFEVVVCREDTEEGKPSPQPLQKALELLGCKSGIYVGDTVDDMKAAKQAGLFAIGVVSHNSTPELLRQAGADEIIDDINKLGELLT